MIHVDRSNPISDFTNYVRKDHPLDWADFSVGHKDLYLKCRNALLKEQNGMSAYTEKPLDENSGQLHIDHFRKKGMNEFRCLMFVWSNYIVDERNEKYGAVYKDKMVHTAEDYEMLIDPVAETDPSRFFTYMENGRMMPASDLCDSDKEKALYTINAFGLNDPSLQSMRSEILTTIDNYCCGELNSTEITEALDGFGFVTLIDYKTKNVF